MEFSGFNQDNSGGKVTVWTVEVEVKDVGELHM